MWDPASINPLGEVATHGGGDKNALKLWKTKMAPAEARKELDAEQPDNENRFLWGDMRAVDCVPGPNGVGLKQGLSGAPTTTESRRRPTTIRNTLF